MKKSSPLITTAVAAALALPGVAHAFWLSSPVDNNYNNNANWSTGNAATDGVFNGPSSITTLNTSGSIYSLYTMLFTGASADAYTIGVTANQGVFQIYNFGGVTVDSAVTNNEVINIGLQESSGEVGGQNALLKAGATNGSTLTFNGNYNAGNNSGAQGAGLSHFLQLDGAASTLGIYNGNIGNGKTAAGAATAGNVIIRKAGAGTWTLNGTNTYSGGTELGSGRGNIILGNKAAFGTGAVRFFDGLGSGTLSANTDLSGANAIANSILYTTGSTTTTTSNANLTFTAGSNVAVLNSGTTPAVGDVIQGAALANIPVYTRVTAVSGSSITLSNVAGVAGTNNATGLQYNGSGSGTINLAGSNPLEFSGTQSLTSTFSNLGAATATFNVTNTADTIFSGLLQQAGGTANVVKSGAGKLILSAANTYTGSTTINGGTLQLGNGGATGSLATASALSIGTGANLTINRSTTTTQGTDFSGAAISGLGSFTAAGTGTTVFTASNTYSGTTTINAGSTLQIGNAGTTGALSTFSAIVDNGTLVFNRSDYLGQGSAFSGAPISGSGGIKQINATSIYNPLGLNAANTYTGTTTISSGTITVGANNVLSDVAGPLGKSTSAILLGDANSPASAGAPNVNLQVETCGTTVQNFTFSRNIDSTNSANTSGRNAFKYQNFNAGGQGTLTMTGSWMLSNTANRSSDIVASSSGMTLDFQGTITGGNASAGVRINGYGAGTGTVRLSNASNTYLGATYVSQGTLLIAGDAAAASGVLGKNSSLIVGDYSNSAAALTDGAFTVGKNITLSVINNATNTWTLGGNTANASAFTGPVGTTGVAYSPTLRLTQVAGGTVTFGGVISANPDATGLTNVAKVGAGTVNITANNTYDGTTIVTAGTLLVNNTPVAGVGSGTGNGTVTVNAGTLGGTGKINGATTINAGATLTAGATDAPTDLGTLSFGGALTLASSTSIINLQAGSTTSYDKFVIGGGLTYNGALSVADTGAFDLSGQNGTYNLFNGFTAETGDFSSVTVDSIALTNLSGIWTGSSGATSFTFTESSGVLNVTAVPEPSTWLGAGFSSALALWSQRKNRSAHSV